MKNPIARQLSPAERAEEDARLARARVLGAVRNRRCTQCGAAACAPCSVRPPADCLLRWLRAYAEHRISRDDLIAAISGLVVVTVAELVPERFAGRPGNRLLTRALAAALLQVKPMSVTRWARNGQLSVVWTPGGHRRYSESEVRGFLRSGRAL